MPPPQRQQQQRRRQKQDAELNISDVMKRLKKTHSEKKKVRPEYLQGGIEHSIHDVCLHILERIMKPDTPKMILPKQKIPDLPTIPRTFESAEAHQLHRLEGQRFAALEAFHEVCVTSTEKAFQTYSQHQKKTNEWRVRRFADIEKKEKKWKEVADRMAEVQEKRMSVTREKVEQEWQSLIDCLPDGVQKQLLRQYDMPISDRAELCGGADTDSIFSRMRRQEQQDLANRDVHWRLRNTAEEVAMEFRSRVEASFSASLKAVGKNVVETAKKEIAHASVRLRTIDAGLRTQMDVIASTISAEGARRVHDAVKEAHEKKKIEHLNRLAVILSM